MDIHVPVYTNDDKCNKHLYCLFSRYGRAEVMAGFVNGLFLVFVAFFIFSEAVEVGVLFFEKIP